MSADKSKPGSLEALLGDIRVAASPFRTYLNEMHTRFAGNADGKVADYIPELARANPDWFGISVVTVDGQVFDIGDAKQTFTIQSLSKPFVFGMALEDRGREYTLSKVGVEPTGDAFNSIIKLDEKSGRPYNPMINAGAIATADLVKGSDLTERFNRMLAMLGRYAGRELAVDMAVYTSERTTGHRNRAIAHLMLNFGMVEPNISETLDLYFQQCSVLVTAKDLAAMGATLANGGVNPLTGETAIERPFVQDVLSIMYTCGMYDYAGEWAYRVGLPAKSGVGGGVVAVVPGKMGIAIFSPRLDAKGNSVRAIQVCRALSEELSLHCLAPSSNSNKLDELLKPGSSRKSAARTEAS
jgi:glutaminase